MMDPTAAPGRVEQPAPLLRADYRWEKIVRAVALGERLSYSEAAEWLIARHPEYPADELPIIRKAGSILDDEQTHETATGGGRGAKYITPPEDAHTSQTKTENHAGPAF